MKRLTLLRHAKSDWDDPVARDFDRPLNDRGKRAAALMGVFARNQAMQFDMIIASPAVRVIETLETFTEHFGQSFETRWERRIYLASSVTLMDVLRDTPASVESLLMVGHNPGLEDLILGLVPDTGDNGLRAQVETKFPTASIAVMDIDIESWSGLDVNLATLSSFTRPRDLDPALGPETL